MSWLHSPMSGPDHPGNETLWASGGFFRGPVTLKAIGAIVEDCAADFISILLHLNGSNQALKRMGLKDFTTPLLHWKPPSAWSAIVKDSAGGFYHGPATLEASFRSAIVKNSAGGFYHGPATLEASFWSAIVKDSAGGFYHGPATLEGMHL